MWNNKNLDIPINLGFLSRLGMIWIMNGAGGGTRTHTLLPAADFESAASTNSATPAGVNQWVVLYLSIWYLATIIFISHKIKNVSGLKALEKNIIQSLYKL